MVHENSLIEQTKMRARIFDVSNASGAGTDPAAARPDDEGAGPGVGLPGRAVDHLTKRIDHRESARVDGGGGSMLSTLTGMRPGRCRLICRQSMIDWRTER